MTITREEWDGFYHVLRKLSVTEDPYETAAAENLYSHLVRDAMDGGSYPNLLWFLEFYGTRYLLDQIRHLVDTAVYQSPLWSHDVIVELGAGNGWLAKGLTALTGKQAAPILIDKRAWAPETRLCDLENAADLAATLCMIRQLDGRPLIVGSEFLHCVDNPGQMFEAFSEWPQLYIEYYPTAVEHWKSYREQISRYGANPIDPSRLVTLLQTLGDRWDASKIGDHTVIQIDPKI